MTGSSSTQMLPLLLLSFFICFHQSSSAPTSREFTKNVQSLEKIVKDCPVNCSSVNITDKLCQCLSLNVSQVKCAFREYFTEGLKDLQHRIMDITINHLVFRLQSLSKHEEDKFCQLSMNYEPIISPKQFHSKLETLIQQRNAPK